MSYAVLKAAEALDVDRNELVDSFRTDSHRNALQQAGMYRLAANAISTSAPRPPKTLNPVRARGGDKHTGRSQTLTVNPGRGMQFGSRRRSWS